MSPHTARWQVAVLATLVGYAFAESVGTIYDRWTAKAEHLVELVEVNGDQAGEFDAVRGYRLDPASRRYALFSQGRVEWQTWRRGNRAGFHDLDEFQPAPQVPRPQRFAVYGDSFTAASYLNVSWTDRTESRCTAAGHPRELLNFAVDGAGLANWWSVATRFVEPSRFELDGVIFAVWGDDLWRTFTFAAPGPDGDMWMGRWPTWDRSTYPRGAHQVAAWLQPTAARAVSTADFDAALSGSLPPVRRWRVAGQLRRAAWRSRAWWQRPPVVRQDDAAEHAARQLLIDQLADQLRRRQWPALVVWLPVKPGDLAPDDVLRYREQSREFARRLGAQFLDLGELFSKSENPLAYWLVNDNHWNQAGSDRFAETLERVLTMHWPPGASP